MQVKYQLSVSLIAASVAGIVSGPIAAQEPTRSTPQLEEIVVTVRKTAENLQRVPLAVTAFDQRGIEDAAIARLEDVAAFTPGLTFSNVFGDFLPAPVIRGMAPTDIFGENNTSIFVDGVYVSGREGLNFSQLDIERIEIVKGPQSAMYGRNSFSGAINIITGNPTDEFDGLLQAKVGNDGRFNGSATVSGPLLGDTLTGRLAVSHDEWDGSYDNANPRGNQNIGGYQYDTVQGKLAWAPAESLDVVFAGYYSNDQIDPTAIVGIPANCEDRNGVPGQPPGMRLQNYCGKFQGIDTGDIAVIPEATGEDRDVVRGSLTIDWRAGPGTLTSLTGYSSVDHKSLEDASWNQGDSYPWIYARTGGQLASFPSAVLRVDDGARTDEWSEELRWTSAQDRRVRYTGGLYYYSVERKTYEPTLIAQQALPADLAGLCPCIGPFFPGGPAVPIGTGAYGPWFTPNGSAGSNANQLNQTQDTNAWAVFAAIDADLTTQLTGRVELRYTDEEKKIKLPLAMESRTDRWDSWTGRASLSYQLTDATMFYGSLARGGKAAALIPSWTRC
ncbi:MAG: TonB-dependent receptor [Gammaproteobacteria bacterium]